VIDTVDRARRRVFGFLPGFSKIDQNSIDVSEIDRSSKREIGLRQFHSKDGIDMGRKLKALLFAGLITVLGANLFAVPASAQDVDFQGKTVTVIIPSAPGGGTDAIGRMIGRFLHDYLPGKPAVTFSNLPGGAGIKALNYFVQQVKPDGLTVFSGSSSNIEPNVLRNPVVQYDPKKLMMIGGFPAPTSVMILRKDAVARLTDKSKPAVIKGDVTADRTTDQMAVWAPNYLGWNVRWVLGYPGTQELIIALQRGETDLMITYGDTLLDQLKKEGNYVFLAQTGDMRDGKLVPGERFPDVPVFSDLLKPQLKDPRAIKAFEAWEALARIGKWATLPPNTPPEIVAAYRQAFLRMVKDKDFNAEAFRILGGGFTVATGEEMQRMTLVADAISDDDLDFFAQLKKNIGIQVELGPTKK
jgi:tripartite-type tricarboxylate transporter receptor subunit TctC